MGRSVEQLVNQEVLRWLAAQQKKDTPPESRVVARQKPMITISRQYGCGGGDLGRAVASELGIDFFGQELVHEVAKRADVRRKVVLALDERARSGVELWIDELLSLRRFAPGDYLHGLSETVVAVARHSPGVIVGRGGHLLLDQARTLRVRCVAPEADRVRAVAQRERMSEVEAQAEVRRVDRERSEFFRETFGTDIDSPVEFDLVVNTKTLGLQGAADLVCSLYRDRFG